MSHFKGMLMGTASGRSLTIMNVATYRCVLGESCALERQRIALVEGRGCNPILRCNGCGREVPFILSSDAPK